MPVTVAGPLTPYVTPQIIQNAPTGVTWKTIPWLGATVAEQQAEQMNICMRATSMCETTCNNVLRATIDTETLYGPDFRVTVNSSTCVTRCEMSRYPVTQVLSGQVSDAATFPPQWSAIAGNQFAIERPPLGIYGTSAPANEGGGGQAILIAPGYVSWFNGRRGYQVQVTYVNGWPHTSLTAAVAPGVNAIQVDDCTGWGPVTAGGQGASGILYDGNDQEVGTVLAASAQSGPGVLTLSTALQFGHGAGVVLSTFPAQVMQAAILFAAAEALVRGSSATVIQSIAGTGQASSANHYELSQIARELLYPYRRII
jgi:hypothetical protein